MDQPDSRDFSTKLKLARSDGVSERQELLESYRNYLLLLASIRSDPKLRGKLGDSDLVQETLIQAHHDFDQFHGLTETELIGWLRAIMTMKKALLARQYYGAQARDPRLEQQLDQDMEHSSQQLDRAFIAPGASPSEQADGRERCVLLADALAALPKHYRDVVVLHHFKGYKLPEVAEAMGRSVDSVKKLWARAMVQLRASLRRLE